MTIIVPLVKFIIVVLGSHISEIQKDRVNTAISYSQNVNSYIWFLTGGIKNDINMIENKNNTIGFPKTEAHQMMECLNTQSNNIILDENAKNTAENLVNLKKWIKKNNFIELPKIVITTSNFHKNRAEMIFKGIFHDYDIDPIWNLSNLACVYCWQDENMHIKNVPNDIKNALEL